MEKTALIIITISMEIYVRIKLTHYYKNYKTFGSFTIFCVYKLVPITLQYLRVQTKRTSHKSACPPIGHCRTFFLSFTSIFLITGPVSIQSSFVIQTLPAPFSHNDVRNFNVWLQNT